MIANYHTHTYRCHHARNSEWEYVENAMAGGLKILGFADHAPYPYPEGYRSSIRMTPDDLAGYIEAVELMKRLYGDRIEIHCGLEAEYYPGLFPQFLEMLRQTPGVEYLILGQHYYYNEYDAVTNGKAMHTSKPTEDEKLLIQFVDQVIEGMETGKFLYVCHPDVINFQGDMAVYRQQMQRLCRAANALKMPLEVNMQGWRSKFSYPRGDFWAIAAEENCTAVIGTDAHKARFTCALEEINAITAEFVDRYGLKLAEQLEIKEDLLK